MDRKATPTTEALDRLAADLFRQLEALPVYQEYMAVRKTLDDIRGIRRTTIVPVGTAVETNTADGGGATIHVPPIKVRLGRVTAIGAAMRALEETGRPMNIHELVEAVQRLGFEFTGSAKSPPSALSVYLSKRKEKSPIVSVWVNNKPMWWFRDQPVPGAEVE